jgi:hypothetical protein
MKPFTSEHLIWKYKFRKMDMMKKVFGYAEEELKRRATQPFFFLITSVSFYIFKKADL